VALVGPLAAACGQAARDTQTATSATSNATPQATPAAAARLVKHAMGETKVPASPQRVVTLDTGELDGALALGVTPVGAATWWQEPHFRPYLGDKTKGITWVGLVNQPNLESIATLKPDLILTNKSRHEKIYGQLSRIAPTVVAESIGVAWKQHFKLNAEALGKMAEYEKLMTDYHQRAADFKAKMGDKLQTTEVSVIRSFPDEIRILMKANYTGTILEDLGIKRPATQNKDIFMEEGSRERIPDMDGDVIFVSFWGDAKEQQESRLKELMKDPLWSQLRAVKAGRVYEVNDDIWASSIGILGASQMMDDVIKRLTAL